MGNNRFAPKLRDFQNCIYWVADVLKAILGPHQKKHPLRCGRLVVVFLGFRFCLLISNPAPDGSCRCQLLRKRGLNRNTAETGVLIASGSGRMLDWAWVDSTCTHTHTHTADWSCTVWCQEYERSEWRSEYICLCLEAGQTKIHFRINSLKPCFTYWHVLIGFNHSWATQLFRIFECSSMGVSKETPSTAKRAWKTRESTSTNRKDARLRVNILCVLEKNGSPKTSIQQQKSASYIHQEPAHCQNSLQIGSWIQTII